MTQHKLPSRPCWVCASPDPGYRHNPALKALYQRIRAQGKAHKVAIIACIGKMLAILNAIIRSKKPFDPKFATP